MHCWLVEDTIEPNARNGSDRTRVILLFEIWRPERSEEERCVAKRDVRGRRRAPTAREDREGEFRAVSPP